VQVKQGSNTPVRCVLSPASQNDYLPYGDIYVSTTDATGPLLGASVFIDGKDFGLLTSGAKKIAPGSYSVSVKADGYIPSETKPATVVTHQSYPLTFVLKPGILAKVFILPRTLNIGRKDGYFIAFVKLPDANNAADVDLRSVYCNGALATRIIRTKVFPHVFAVLFSRGKLVNVDTGENVRFFVSGKVNGKDFLGSDVITVISKPTKLKEDTDDANGLTDDTIFKRWNPF
jgi:hypothetical protein